MFLSKENKIKWKLLAVATVITLALVVYGIFGFDKPVYEFMRHFDCPAWKWVGVVFDAKVWLVVSALSLIVFYVKKAIETKPNIRNSKHYINIWAIKRDFLDKTKNSYAFYIFWSVLVASVVAVVLKFFIGRARPIFYDEFGITGFFAPSTDWAFNSMPSGHAVATFAGLVMIGMLAPKLKWLTWGLAIVVGASRVAHGMHWPTDVILGAFIGMVVADLVKAFIKSRNAE